jgi:hypothetical protein
MTRPPFAPIALGLLGLIPFVCGALLTVGLFPETTFLSQDGRLVLTRYGTIILCFMSGVLWGFATRATGPQATVAYALSVIPALWTFFQPGRSADEALINLMIGFLAVLLLDYAFSRWGLTPGWWMPLRLLLTAIVLICLCIGVWA